MELIESTTTRIVALAVMIIVIAAILIPAVNTATEGLVIDGDNTGSQPLEPYPVGTYVVEVSGHDLIINGKEHLFPGGGYIAALSDNIRLIKVDASNLELLDLKTGLAVVTSTVTFDNHTYTAGTYSGEILGVLYMWSELTVDTKICGFSNREFNFNSWSDVHYVHIKPVVGGSAIELIFNLTSDGLIFDSGYDITHHAVIQASALSWTNPVVVAHPEGNYYTMPAAVMSDLSYTYDGTTATAAGDISGTVTGPLHYKIYSNPENESLAGLFNIIPVILILAAVLLAVAMMRGRS